MNDTNKCKKIEDGHSCAFFRSMDGSCAVCGSVDESIISANSTPAELCQRCGGCFMVPSDDPNGDVMNTACPDCNKPPAERPTPITDAATYRGWGDFKMATEPEVCRDLERQLAEARKDYMCLASRLDGHDATECRMNLDRLIDQRDSLAKELAESIRERDNAISDWKQADTDSIRAIHERNEARKQLSNALALAESNEKLAHDTAIQLRQAREQRDALAKDLFEVIRERDTLANAIINASDVLAAVERSQS